MMRSIWAFKNRKKLKKFDSGMSLVELLVVLSLVTIVISLGYMLFGYGYNTFFIAQGRSDVQQNVRLVSDYIQREVRHAVNVEIRDASIAIPGHSDLELADANIIYRDSDGKIRHRNADGETVLVDGISDLITFDIDFQVSGISNKVLNYLVTGTRDNGQVSTLGTEVFIENLDFTRGVPDNPIKTAGTSSNYVSVYYVKPPTIPSFRMSVVPYFLYVQEGSVSYEFELILQNDNFKASIDSVGLGLAFKDMSPNISRDSDNFNKASLVVSGVLDQSYGTGLITIGGDSLVSGMDLGARVLVLKPVGVLVADPNPFEIGVHDGEQFRLRLDEANSFVNTLTTSMITFGGDLYGLIATSVTRLGPQEATVEVTGTASYLTGAGFITVSGSGLTQSDTALTASITVIPPPPMKMLTISVVGQGRTNPEAGAYSYTSNQTVSVEALDEGSWNFYKWELNNVDAGGLGSIEVLMDSDKVLKAHFRIPFEAIPLGSYVEYNSNTYIKLSEDRLLELYLHEVNDTKSSSVWNSSAEWATHDELVKLDPLVRDTQYRYWTGSQSSDTHAYYIEVGGSINELPKESELNIRRVMTYGGLMTMDGYSGDGSKENPIVLE